MKASQVALLALSFLFFGCANDDRAMNAGAALEQVTGAATVCGDGPTVAGVDVSHWQGDIDWDAVASDGVRFAVIRVSDGVRTPDRNFAVNWADAGRAGLLRGAYQFFRPEQDAIDQADLLIDAMRGRSLELPPVLDVEDVDDLSTAANQAQIHLWMDRVERQLGVTPMIYTGYYVWRDHIGDMDDYAANPLWHAQYTSAACPNIADPWATWTFWQYTDSGRVRGIDGPVDLNRFNGTEDDLAWLAGQAPREAPARAVAPEPEPEPEPASAPASDDSDVDWADPPVDATPRGCSFVSTAPSGPWWLLPFAALAGIRRRR